ncbi:sugar MFS transporter [Novosphingobium aquae]|uniref:Sugar MFS transporter n=1 Tax=Novosphingobium aquae TaxID=3133435 RepID=A0ABU8S4I8_9SPHN
MKPLQTSAAIQYKNGSAVRPMIVAPISLFFIWGGLTSLNDVLIPKLKGLFSLTYTEALLTQFAFFLAYFLVSLPAGSLIARVGYLKGIVIGLGTMALGCLAFIPAASSGVYATFLLALFVLASGITILQVAANPLIANMGSRATASSRLTLAQAFNSLGTTVFPPIGGAIILGSLANIDPVSLPENQRTALLAKEAAVIGDAYLGIAAVLALIAGFFWLQRNQMPRTSEPQISYGGSFALLREQRLGGGVAAIFLYVGAEVSIGSMLINYLVQPNILGVTERAASAFIAFYWGGAMAGRFIGSIILRFVSPGLVLAAFAFGAAALATISGLSSGPFAAYALLAVGLMNSIMFPTIFSLGVDGLGERTPQGSGLLCMGIVGGALIPLLFGTVADASGLATALFVPVCCYLAIAFYGWVSRRAAG